MTDPDCASSAHSWDLAADRAVDDETRSRWAQAINHVFRGKRALFLFTSTFLTWPAPPM